MQKTHCWNRAPLARSADSPTNRHAKPGGTILSTAISLIAMLLACTPVDIGTTGEEIPKANPRPIEAVALPKAENKAASSPSPKGDPIQAQIMEALSRPRHSWTKPELKRLAQTIAEECERHDFEPELILAVILVESGGRPKAVSHVGALGLMQIMPPTGAEVARKLGVPWNGPNTLLDPIVNIKLGVAYLRTLTNRYDDMSTALAAYNWGPGRIDRRLRRGEELPTEYINRVTQLYGRKPGPETGRS
ncbi:MAG: transglycosylase SLT domain-containing protein [Myxococcota bacterium]